MKGQEEWEQPPTISCELAIFSRRGLLRFILKKQVNLFIRVKIVIMLNFHNVKVIFIVFMQKINHYLNTSN